MPKVSWEWVNIELWDYTAIHWSLPSKQESQGFSLSVHKGNATQCVRADWDAGNVLITHTAPASLVVRTASHTLFYINSQCKEACLFGANQCRAMRFKLVHFLLHVPRFNKLRLLWEMWWYFESSSPYPHKTIHFLKGNFPRNPKMQSKLT